MDRWEPAPVPKGDGRHDIGDDMRAAIVHRLMDDWSRDPDLTPEKVRQLAMWAGASVRALFHELGTLRDMEVESEQSVPHASASVGEQQPDPQDSQDSSSSSPAPEPQTPAQPAEELIEHHKKECNRYGNGFCGTVRCMKRGGWKPDSGLGYEVATCEAHETVLILAKLQRLSTAHETLQADYADSDAARAAFQQMAMERREEIERLRDVIQEQNQRISALTFSRETEQRTAVEFGAAHAAGWFRPGVVEAKQREAWVAYQQRQPQEDGQS